MSVAAQLRDFPRGNHSTPANLGLALLAVDEVTEARRVLEAAHLANPDHEAVTQQLAIARARSGATNAALELTRQWTAAHPDDAAALQIEADVRAALHDFAGAEAAVRRALTLKPSDIPLHVALGTYLAAQGQAAAAQASFEQSLQTLGDRAEIQHNLARLLLTAADLQARHPDRALTLARSLVTSHVTAPRLETLALALAETGNWEQAASVVGRAAAALGEDGSTSLRRRVARVRAAIQSKTHFREAWPFADE